MCQRTLTTIRRAASALVGITFHGRTALRTASVFALAALLLTMAPSAVALQLLLPRFTVDFTRLICVKETDDCLACFNSQDEPYVFFVVGNLVTGELVVKRTSVFSDVDTGESRDQTVRLWGPTGVATTFPNNNPDNLVILVLPMEHDDCDVNKLQAKLQSSLSSRFLTLRAQLGGITRSQLVTSLITTMAIQQQCSSTTTFGTRDLPLGNPLELRITASDVLSGTAVLKTLNFDDRSGGSEGFYQTVFRVQSSILTFQSVGTFELTPSAATFTRREDKRLGYEFTWTVPQGEVWRDLQTLDLRIGDEEDPLLWVRFTEADGSLALIDPATGEVDRSGSPDTHRRLQTRNATVHLAESQVVGSGPTGDSVTLELSLSFKPKAAGRTYPVEVRAVDDDGNEHDFEPAGTLTVE
jgi:hypothetical protein